MKFTYAMFAFFHFSQIVNNEMFWVVTEICSEANLVKRMKLIKAFIKIASKSDLDNSMLSI